MRSRKVKKYTQLKVLLCDTNPDLVIFWKKYFRLLPEVEIFQGNIFDLKAESIVSPANSFGFMGGGIDLAYRDKFGLSVEKLVQQNIEMRFYGELKIGQALSVPMQKQEYKHLIVAPTMRMPMKVDNTLNAFDAFRAALLEAKDKGFESILSPGMCTGAGQACPEMVARQMFTAYIGVILNRRPKEFNHIAKQMNWMLRCSQDPKPIGV